MTSAGAWLDYVAAVRAMKRAQVRLDKGDFDSTIHAALSSGDGYWEALFYLSTVPSERLSPFLYPLVHRALESGREMEHLRELLSRANRAALDEHLADLVEEVIAAGDGAWSRYRPLVELLDQLSFPGLLRQVVEVASKSSNEDIREVAEDFPVHRV